MTTVALLVAAAALAYGVATWLRSPAGPWAVLAGIGLGMLDDDLRDFELVRDALMLSATFLVFAVGAELDRRQVMHYRRAAAGVAALQLAFVVVTTWVLAWILALPWLVTVYVMLALGASST